MHDLALPMTRRPGDPTTRWDGLFMALLLASVAVTIAALATSNPVFLVAGSGIALVIAAAFRFDLFVYTLIFLLPWYPYLDTRLPLRDVSMVLRFVLLAAVFFIRKKNGQSLAQWILGNRIRKVVLVFAGIAIVSLLLSSLGPNIDALRLVARLFSYLAFFFAVLGWVETRQQVQRIITVLLTSTIGVALFGFYQVLAQGYTDFYFYLYPSQEQALDSWNGRITSVLFHFNSLAGYLNLVLPFSLACMVLAKERWQRNLAVVCHSLACAALYFTASRGGLVAYAGMVLAVLWFLKPRFAALSRLLVATILAAVIVFSLQSPSAGGGRVQDVDDFTSTSRLALWSTAATLFLQHPVLGVGYGNYRSLYNDYLPGVAPNELDTHNLYLQFLAETGIIGFAAFFFLIGSFVRIAVKLARNGDPYCRLLGIGLGGALAATLIHGLVDFLFNVSPQCGALFWLVLALGLIAYEQCGKTTFNLPRAKREAPTL